MAASGLYKKIPEEFTPVDVDAVCRIWTQTSGGDDVRMTNRALALRIVTNALNVLACMCPRLVFSKVQRFDDRQETSPTNYLYRWLVNDVVDNGRHRDFKVLSCPRETDPATGDGIWYRLDSSLAEDTGVEGLPHNDDLQWTATEEDIVEERATHDRGDAPDAEQAEGIQTENDHTIVDVCVQDKPVTMADTGLYTFVHNNPSAGEPCLANWMEEIRSKLHEIRTTNLPIVACWAATGDGAYYATPTDDTGDETGVCITNDSEYVNILDPTETLYTAAAAYTWDNDPPTPGIRCFPYKCMHGDEENCAEDKKLKVTWRILAEATTADATALCAGPTSILVNQDTISIPTASGLDWFGSDTDLVALDTTSSNDDATTSMGKLDFAAIAGASGKVYVYGILAWILYG